MRSIVSSAPRRLHARGRLAIERVLADVEIERRKIGVHEARQRGDDPGVVELGVGLAHHRVEFGEPVQHQPLELGRRRREPTSRLRRVMGERAEHPAQRVAQLAVIVADAFQDFRADALVVGIVDARHPQPQDVGARLLDDVLRKGLVAERLRHLAALLVEREAVRQHDVEGRAAARAAAFEQRRLEPAAMLVGAFEIHHLVGAAVDACA